MADKTKTKKFSLDELASQYGYAAAFFFSDPELKALIQKAVKEQWTADKFRAKFMATKWYRSKSADVRTWLELEARDPAEARKRLSDQTFAIRQMANQMGISLDAGRLSKMARDSLMFGWPQELLQQMVGAEFKYQPAGGGTQGQAATLETNIRQLAGDYGVTISDAQVGQWVGGALQGRYSEDHLQDFIRDMAKSKYAGLTSYLDQGFTVRQIAEPYLQSYAQILEMAPDTIQLTDPKIQQALQGQPAAAKGGAAGPPVAQTLYDFERGLRKDPRWLQTKNAKQSMTDAALGILQDWGLYG